MPSSPPVTTLAYLLSEYPLLEHTYLLREVRRLRELAWNIQTISIRRPEDRQLPKSKVEEEEQSATWYILDGGISNHLVCHIATFRKSPLRYLRGLAAAWKFGGPHPKSFLLATAYFCEAVTVGHKLRAAGIRHIHSVYSTTVAMLLARIFDVRLSITLHGSAEFLNPLSFAIREKVGLAELVCSISDFGKSQIMLSSPYADWYKLRVTPLGVDIREWQPSSFRESSSPFELLAVGRLVGCKGCPLLLEAVASLRAQGRNLRLTLVGDGPLRSWLEQLAKRLRIDQQVVFAGWKTQDELRGLYASSDLCLLASFAEGVPVVLMEAMAAGLPCVAPRINGIPELIRDGIDGLLFTPSNTDELVAAIARLMDDHDLRRQMALSSRERITDKYDLLKNSLYLSEIFSHWISPATVAAVTPAVLQKAA